MNKISDHNLKLKDKKVSLRVDLNVPIKDGTITETSRIEKIIPTIKLLIEKEAKIKLRDLRDLRDLIEQNLLRQAN